MFNVTCSRFVHLSCIICQSCSSQNITLALLTEMTVIVIKSSFLYRIYVKIDHNHFVHL